MPADGNQSGPAIAGPERLWAARPLKKAKARSPCRGHDRLIDRGALYKLLHNRIYRGEITHKDET